MFYPVIELTSDFDVHRRNFLDDQLRSRSMLSAIAAFKSAYSLGIAFRLADGRERLEKTRNEIFSSPLYFHFLLRQPPPPCFPFPRPLCLPPLIGRDSPGV